ncbi:hypothetical protein AGDE_16274 [Angomonas deanei]|uniref:Uncharacterized protein n=1 Tax=Angomonas deanei TaxID=59799 RepID=A0A7G2C473_9TRYP|nr:hypothetical protein AGDE_16274 [Angomonas deanei]CAD2213527.1 hypothetical protein, conserved [Angomonas deanei]|eukprot:EPY17392.1 hypothetical protein AGDE_16274 [Angomonas deanei]
MFFTAGDKFSGKVFGDWETRLIAFDCSRRYMYYSEAVSYPLHFEYNIEPDNYCGQKAKWRKKFKVTAVRSLTVERRVSYSSSTFVPQDLLQLEFEGEERPFSQGEIPPAGPLLHPTTDLSPYDKRLYAVGNEDFLRDPFGLIDLYQGLRDLFEEIKREREIKIASAARNGNVIPYPETATYQSPRAADGSGGTAKRTVKAVFRCRDEREFRRLWYVVQTVLGYDKFVLRPYRGLPPYDPRNGVAFSHIPMALWHEFKGLDTTVFYCFTTGDVVCASPKMSELQVMLRDVAMFVTHDTVYFMRNSGSIVRWIRLHDVKTFHYNVTSGEPFVSFICERPVPDTLFIPRKDDEFKRDMLINIDFHANLQVQRIRRVIHDSCFASLSVRRVFKMEEVWDHTPLGYLVRMAKSGMALCMTPGEGFNYTVNCPLPKEQLASVWFAVQAQLRSIGRLTNSAAIPLYGSNAAEVRLSELQLQTVANYLEERRESGNDIVGIPLEEAQRVTVRPNTPSRHSNISTPTSARSPDPFGGSSHSLDQLRTPQLTLGQSKAKKDREAQDGGEEVVYTTGEAKYYTAEEAEKEQLNVIKEEHVVMPEVEGEGGFVFQTTLDDILNHSMQFYFPEKVHDDTLAESKVPSSPQLGKTSHVDPSLGEL